MKYNKHTDFLRNLNTGKFSKYGKSEYDRYGKLIDVMYSEYLAISSKPYPEHLVPKTPSKKKKVA